MGPRPLLMSVSRLVTFLCAAHTLRPTMAPKLRRPAAAARVARTQQIANANERLANRRSALRALNGVLRQLGRDILRVDVKEPTVLSCNKLFRFLARRELDPATASKCRSAITMYVDNGGKLPENISLHTTGAGVLAAEDATE